MIINLNKNNKKNKNILAELDQVTKVFTNGEIVLKNLNLKIFKNDFITLLGKSGCGKTTILKILCGLLKTTEGKVNWPTSTFKNSDIKSGVHGTSKVHFEVISALLPDNVFNVKYSKKRTKKF